MPELSEKYFEGKCDIPAKKVKELLTKGNEDSVIETLTKLGWEGQLIATVNLKLSAERRRADDGQVMGKDVMIQIDTPPGQLLKFEGGNLYSEYLDQGKVRYKLVKDGRILTEADKKDLGLGDFCLRVLAHLGKNSNSSNSSNFLIKLSNS